MGRRILSGDEEPTLEVLPFLTQRKRGGKKQGSKNITSFPGEMQQAVGGKQRRPRREMEKEKECAFLSIHPDFKAEAW